MPHGIRLAIEHAMRENLIRFVVCTSTLAQGVNLPIRYLIVTSIYQAGEPIKVRDFHNLLDVQVVPACTRREVFYL